MHDFESLIFSLVGDNRCWSNKSANTYSLDPCNKSMGSLNRLQKPNPSPPKHNGMNKTAEQDLALQKGCLALLIHQAD